MTDLYSQNRCVCSTRSHGPLPCAFCLSFHFNSHTAERWMLRDMRRQSRENPMHIIKFRVGFRGLRLGLGF